MNRVCVDASVALMLLLPDDLSAQARALWRSWVDGGVELVVPPLFYAEVISVLREKVHCGRIEPDEGDAAFAAYMKLDVTCIASDDLQVHAWALAKEYNHPRACDAQ